MNDVDKEIVLLKSQEEETAKECAKQRDDYANVVLNELGPSMKEFLKEEEEEEKKETKFGRFLKKVKNVLG